MTVSNTTNKIIYAGNGSTDTFAYNYKILAQSDLVVTEVLIATGAETVLELTTDYTVTGVGEDGGGNVVLVAGNLPSTKKLSIRRSTPIKQSTDYISNDPFPAETHEAALDKLTFICQDLQEQIDRSVKVGEVDDEFSVSELSALLVAAEDAQAAAEAAQAAAETAETNAETAEANAEAAQAAAEAAISSFTGVVLPYAGATAPTGWLLCYGQAVSRTTYATLFALIGTTYGVGDGSTTFNLPDLRGRFPLGKDDMGGSGANRVTATEADNLGQASGAETKNLQHTHSVSGSTSSASATGNCDGSSTPFIGTHSHTVSLTSGTGGSTTQDIMNPYQTLNYIIKT